MLSGVDYIFIFQSVILISAYLVFLHVFFKQRFHPISLFIVGFGMISVQLSNYLLLTIFDKYVIEVISILIIVGPIVEESFKMGIMIYLVVRLEDKIRVRQVVFQGSLVGLGFGIGELIGYTLIFGTQILVQRSVLLVFGHPLYSALIGLSLFGLNANNLKNLDLPSLLHKKFTYVLIFPTTIILHSLWNLLIIRNFRLLVLNITLHSFIWYGLVRVLYDCQPVQSLNSELTS